MTILLAQWHTFPVSLHSCATTCWNMLVIPSYHLAYNIQHVGVHSWGMKELRNTDSSHTVSYGSSVLWKEYNLQFCDSKSEVKVRKGNNILSGSECPHSPKNSDIFNPNSLELVTKLWASIYIYIYIYIFFFFQFFYSFIFLYSILAVCLSTNGERALNYTIVKWLILTSNTQAATKI